MRILIYALTVVDELGMTMNRSLDDIRLMHANMDGR